MQSKGCPLSMLYLVCVKLRAWPSGIREMSGLQYLYLDCKRLHDQDLAALQLIPHVNLELQEFSTFLLTSGSWESLQILGQSGFSINFSNADALSGAPSDSFSCAVVTQRETCTDMHAACMRQWVACHVCEHSGVAPIEQYEIVWGA